MISVAANPRHSVEVGGQRISYVEAGSGSPAVVFIHGAFGDSSYFTPQLSHLAPRRRVIAPDLRGHGESDAPPAVSVDDLARDVIAVCADAGVERAVLCGHSIIGAATALAAAAARPELVLGVAILDAVLFPPPRWRESLEELLRALDGEHWVEALEGYFGRTLDANDPPELAARVMADLARPSRDTARSIITGFLAVDLVDGLQHARCPLMYIHAKAPADLSRLAQLRPDALIGQVVGSGHYLMLVVPDQVNAMLDRFLELVELDHDADGPAPHQR